ncbi:hypothetical protein DFH09DRAFT_1155112 [Mycena vulgaris]|nr:hypothetical protein DFH09DRAFT_1155112 [Mycena vulgaris]
MRFTASMTAALLVGSQGLTSASVLGQGDFAKRAPATTKVKPLPTPHCPPICRPICVKGRCTEKRIACFAENIFCPDKRSDSV